MKKLVLFLAAAFMIVQVSKAEIFSFGIKAGLGYSNLQISDLTGINSGSEVYDLVTGDGVMAYHIGFQSQIKIAMFYIQPELYFNDGGGTLEKVVEGNPTSELISVDFKRVDLPIMLGGKIGPLRINAGPVGSYVIKESVTSDIEDLPDDYSVFTQSMTWGFQAGLGVDLWKLTIDARYEGSLSELGDSFTIGGATFQLDARPSQWVFSLGFWF
jgi:hypothetical protein